MQDTATVVTHLQRAESTPRRMIGLLGRSSLPAGHGLLITPCKQIHTWFMRFAIDAVFLDREQRVVHICSDLRPWKLSPMVWKARSVLELASGQAVSLQVGQRLHLGDDVVTLKRE